MSDSQVVTAVGSVGGPGFVSVDGAGRIAATDGSFAIDCWIGADDGWHVPADEPSTRASLAGPGIVETRVKVPAGDAVLRVFGIGGPGDVFVVEVENDSPAPFGVAFGLHGTPALTFVKDPFPLEEPPGACDSAIHVPVTHRTVTRAALMLHPRGGPAPDAARLPSSDQAARAWRAHLDAGLRVDLPDPVFTNALDAARAWLLQGDDGVQPVCRPLAGAWDAADAATHVLALAAWGHGSHASELAPSLPRRARKRAASRVLDRPFDDPPEGPLATVDAMLREASPRTTWAADGDPHHGGRTAAFLLAARACLLDDSGGATGDGPVHLLPDIPPSWRGAPIEVHDAPLFARGARGGDPVGEGRLSFAVRWHDDRPALLWSVDGPPRRLTIPGLDPDWATTEPRGDALLSPVAVA